MRRAYAWPYPFSQAPSQTLQYLFLCTPCKPAPVHTLHPVVSACCSHLPLEGLLQHAIFAGAAGLRSLCCHSAKLAGATLGPHTQLSIEDSLSLYQASAGRSAPGQCQAAPTRSLFQAAILARRSALDSRLLRSLRPPSLCESLQSASLTLCTAVSCAAVLPYCAAMQFYCAKAGRAVKDCGSHEARPSHSRRSC